MTLYDDGDTATLTDGRTVRLRIEPDMGYNGFDEVECYGQIAAYKVWDRDGARAQRPEGFDGNAEKLSIINDVVWWQPPADVKRTDPGFREFRQLVADLASFGWKQVGVEILDGTDAYGRPIVVDAAWIGGVDSVDDGYLAELVNDHLSELGVTLADDAA